MKYFLVFVTFLNSSLAALAGELTILTEAKLKVLLTTLEPLKFGSETYTNWADLIATSAYLQKCEPASVRECIARIQESFPPAGDFEASSRPGEIIDLKLYLIMRTIFALPEDITEKEIEATGGWNPRFSGYLSMGREINPGGSFNLAWPLSWKNGKPNLVSDIAGRQGVRSRYHAADEYSYFIKKYPFRNLKIATFDR